MRKLEETRSAYSKLFNIYQGYTYWQRWKTFLSIDDDLEIHLNRLQIPDQFSTTIS